MKHWKILFKTIGIGIFIWICFRLDMELLKESFEKMDIQSGIIAIFLVFFLVGIKTIRFMRICSISSYIEAYILFFIGIFWGVVTPGKIGELYKAVYLEKKGMPRLKAYASVIADRIYDIFTLCILAVGAVMYIGFHQARISVIILAAAFLFFYSAIFTDIGNKLICNIGIRFFNKLSGEDILESILIFRKDFWILNIISFLGWFIFYGQLYIIALALKIPISYIQLVCVMAITNVVMLVPVTVFGVGTRDISILGLFSLLHISKEQAVSFSLLLLLLYIINGAIGMLFYLLRRKE